MNILEKIIEKTKDRVARQRNMIGYEQLKSVAYQLPKDNFSFEIVLKKRDISFICETKKASPSKGIISEDYPYIEIAKQYREAGADAISVLTEPDFFMGSIGHAIDIIQNVNVPVLRKDFIIDDMMIYESKIAKVSAVLLICSILTDKQLRDYIKICDDLGVSCLVEAHDEQEVRRAMYAGARVIGVNNRDLKTFAVDITNSLKCRRLVPPNISFVSESGITSNEQIEQLRKANVNGVLIGETMMNAPDKKAALDALKGIG